MKHTILILTIFLLSACAKPSGGVAPSASNDSEQPAPVIDTIEDSVTVERWNYTRYINNVCPPDPSIEYQGYSILGGSWHIYSDGSVRGPGGGTTSGFVDPYIVWTFDGQYLTGSHGYAYEWTRVDSNTAIIKYTNTCSIELVKEN